MYPARPPMPGPTAHPPPPPEFSDSRKVKLVRNQPGGSVKTIIVDVDAILTRGQIDKDPVLQPDDRIIVPRKFINL